MAQSIPSESATTTLPAVQSAIQLEIDQQQWPADKVYTHYVKLFSYPVLAKEQYLVTQSSLF